MQIEVTVDITTGKYGPKLSKASIVLDSDDVDLSGLSELVVGVVKSAFTRAATKMADLKSAKPIDVVVDLSKATPQITPIESNAF